MAATVRPLTFPIETLILVSMLYKRNQLEDAISSLLEPKVRRPSAKMRTRFKRLFETDRAMDQSLRPNDPLRSNYAFFSDDPPGRGVEVQFSPYEAFALLTAIRLMTHGWTQNIVVSIMRQARDELEAHHARILNSPRQSRPDFENSSPLLVIITSSSVNNAQEAFACSVREGYRKAMEWTWKIQGSGHGFSIFELVRDAQNLAIALEKAQPRHRGQPS